MQRSNPFARAAAMMSLIAAAMSLPMTESQAALAKISPYKSRGKGRGSVPKSYNSPTRFKVQHGGGEREVTRRQRQIANGMLSPIHRAA